ncbi:polysaccharide deacetylase family protein [Micromonospora sp. SH-82]|uniref:polysaccharide deacetylase family protein n=1 Tax=Micromonospora sp. SH-82 TaxID=3132938 RepID=UPI003EC03C20
MWYAGVAWGADGYTVETVDDTGGSVRPRARFGRDRIDDLIRHLAAARPPSGGSGSADGALVTVVDSTNGILDGRMMSAGLTVHRADPPVLPSRPAFGSVSALDLARAAQRDLTALTRLDPRRGTQTGRESDLDAGIAASVPELDALTAAGRCLRHGDRDRPEVALTFDDGPQPPYTGQVLDVLERYGVPATFFCVGLHVGGYPDELARMREQGHEVANHTWSHPFLPELTRSELAAQIERTAEAVERTGAAAPTLFRPPYGSRTPQVMRWLAELDPQVVLWDVEPFDWAMPGADTIARITVEQARPGSVILLHDGGGDRSQTVAALPAIIEGLHERGYRFVPAGQLAVPAPASVA